MQVIEDMEESLLSARRGQLLDVVDNQDVDTLIKVDEAVGRIVADGIGVLHHEEMGRNHQHAPLGRALLDAYADGVGQVSLAHARRAVNEKRVERDAGRVVGNGQADAARELVALAFKEVLERIVGVQVRVDVLHHRRRGRSVGNKRRGGRRMPFHRGRRAGRRYACLAAAALVHLNAVHEQDALAESLAYSGAHESEVVFLDDLVDKLAGYAYGELALVVFVNKANELQRFEPRAERLFLRYVFADEPEALFPRLPGFLNFHQ